MLISIFGMHREDCELNEVVNCDQFYMIFNGPIKAHTCELLNSNVVMKYPLPPTYMY